MHAAAGRPVHDDDRQHPRRRHPREHPLAAGRHDHHDPHRGPAAPAPRRPPGPVAPTLSRHPSVATFVRASRHVCLRESARLLARVGTFVSASRHVRQRESPHTRQPVALPVWPSQPAQQVRRHQDVRDGAATCVTPPGRREAAVSSDRAALRLPLPPVLHHLRDRPPHGRRRRSGALPARTRGHRKAAEHRRPRRPGRGRSRADARRARRGWRLLRGRLLRLTPADGRGRGRRPDRASPLRRMIAVWACSPLIGVQRTRPTGDRQQQARAFDDRRAIHPPSPSGSSRCCRSADRAPPTLRGAERPRPDHRSMRPPPERRDVQ